MPRLRQSSSSEASIITIVTTTYESLYLSGVNLWVHHLLPQRKSTHRSPAYVQRRDLEKLQHGPSRSEMGEAAAPSSSSALTLYHTATSQKRLTPALNAYFFFAAAGAALAGAAAFPAGLAAAGAAGFFSPCGNRDHQNQGVSARQT